MFDVEIFKEIVSQENVVVYIDNKEVSKELKGDILCLDENLNIDLYKDGLYLDKKDSSIVKYKTEKEVIELRFFEVTSNKIFF
jgi:hypothetical protein